MIYIRKYTIEFGILSGEGYDDGTKTYKHIDINLREVYSYSEVCLDHKIEYMNNTMLRLYFYFEFNYQNNVFRMITTRIVYKYSEEKRKNKFLQWLIGNKMVLNKSFIDMFDIMMMRVKEGDLMVVKHFGFEEEYNHLCSLRDNFILNLQYEKGIKKNE